MNEEIEDDISDLELEDDALYKKVRKLESEAARILRQSSELLKSLSKDTSKQEEGLEAGNVKGEEESVKSEE